MTDYQSEAQLEDALIDRLGGLGYERVTIRNTGELEANLKRQLEKHNADVLGGAAMSKGEFGQVLNHLAKGSVFEKPRRCATGCSYRAMMAARSICAL